MSTTTVVFHILAILDTDKEVTAPTFDDFCPSGVANVTYHTKCNCDLVKIDLEVVGLTTADGVVATINDGAVGVDGPVVKTLELALVSDVSPTCRRWESHQCWSRSDDTDPLNGMLVDKLLTGGLYVNIATDTNPAGEIRGQLIPFR